MAAGGWFRGTVKAVPSGDTLVIMGNVKSGVPPEKSITLASLIAPRLARRDTNDDPFAWDSREFLRKKCIGKEVTFKVDYVVPTLNNREFGSVFMGDINIALAVASAGWAKVRQGPQNVEKSPYLAELVKAEEQAQQQGLGIWNKTPGASEESIRSIPPSAIGDMSNFDARGLLESNKGKLLPAIVEQVRDGSSFRVYLLPSFQFVQVHLAGVQAPSMGRRLLPNPQTNTENEDTKVAENGASTPLTSAQKLAASANVEAPEEWGREAKHFTEVRILHRDVRIMLEGTDKFNTLFGSVSYVEEEKPMDLALELLKQGLARYAEWSANMLEEDEKRRLKAAELQAKKDRIRLFTGFVIPPSNTKAIKNDVFTGKIIDVVSGDCIVVADDAAPLASPSGERRVNLSSIQVPRKTQDAKQLFQDPLFRDAKEFLRSRLIGQQVHVSMEYSRTIPFDASPTQPEGGSRVLDFGSVFLLSVPKGEALEPPLPGQPEGANVAEIVVANGYAHVVKHRDFDDRSHYYDNLLAAEKKAISGKKGMYSTQPLATTRINDLSSQRTRGNEHQSSKEAQKAKQFLPFLQRTKRHSAVVEFVFSGHRCKLLIPKETCAIAFSLSGVRSPGRGEPYSDEAISFMRRRILQHDVEIEVETVDRNGTFLGSLWEGKGNVAVSLLEAGLAKLQPGFAERVTDGHLLIQAEEQARKQHLKIWENHGEGPAPSEASAMDGTNSKQEVLQVQVTEVLGGGRFYVQVLSDSRVSTIQQQLEALRLKEKLSPVNFQPKKGDLVLAHFSLDDSWYRAIVVSTPRQTQPTSKEDYEVFYIDYGNQETVPLSSLRPMDASVAGTQGFAQLCSLAHIKVPNLEEDFGLEAAEFLGAAISEKKLMAKVEDKDTSGGKVRGQGTGSRLIVTLVDADTSRSINAALLEAGLARLEKGGKWDSKEKKAAVESLAEYQDKARKARLNIWQYGDVESDEEDVAPGRRGGRR